LSYFAMLFCMSVWLRRVSIYWVSKHMIMLLWKWAHFSSLIIHVMYTYQTCVANFVCPLLCTKVSWIFLQFSTVTNICPAMISLYNWSFLWCRIANPLASGLLLIGAISQIGNFLQTICSLQERVLSVCFENVKLAKIQQVLSFDHSAFCLVHRPEAEFIFIHCWGFWGHFLETRVKAFQSIWISSVKVELETVIMSLL